MMVGRDSPIQHTDVRRVYGPPAIILKWDPHTFTIPSTVQTSTVVARHNTEVKIDESASRAVAASIDMSSSSLA
jgi:hypothetical protein